MFVDELYLIDTEVEREAEANHIDPEAMSGLGSYDDEEDEY